MTTKTSSKEQIKVTWMSSNDSILIIPIVIVVSSPAVFHLGNLFNYLIMYELN